MYGSILARGKGKPAKKKRQTVKKSRKEAKTKKKKKRKTVRKGTDLNITIFFALLLLLFSVLFNIASPIFYWLVKLDNDQSLKETNRNKGTASTEQLTKTTKITK